MLLCFSHDINMWFLSLNVFANCHLWFAGPPVERPAAVLAVRLLLLLSQRPCVHCVRVLAGPLLNVLLLSWLYAYYCCCDHDVPLSTPTVFI